MSDADSPAPPPLAACGYTHPGQKREINEDVFGCFADERLYIVADGMGGRAAGDVASRIAVDEVEAFFRAFHADPRQEWPFPVDRNLPLGANLLRVGIQVANRRMRREAAADPARGRMGATMVALAVGDSRLSIAHVGDARAYRLRAGALKRLTRDHSVIEEMLAARPDLSPAEVTALARQNVVTKALGTKDEVDPTLYLNTFQPGDVYLLCSDGLWGSVADDRMAAILGHASGDIEAAGQLLVDAANQAGGPDNISVVVVRT